MPVDPLAALGAFPTGADASRALCAAIAAPAPAPHDVFPDFAKQVTGWKRDERLQVIAASLAGGMIAASGAEPTPARAVAVWREVLEELRR